MSFKIISSNKILNIQNSFTELFPYLKLEFFKRGHTDSDIKQPILSKERTLAECCSITNSPEIEVSPELTVGELESRITEYYGLDVQVFRKSGNVWLLTSFTDSWTLEEQNHQGEIITHQMNERKNKKVS